MIKTPRIQNRMRACMCGYLLHRIFVSYIYEKATFYLLV